MEDYSILTMLSIICLGLAIVLAISYKRNRGRILNGFLFNILLGFLGLDLIAYSFITSNDFIRISTLIVIIVFMIVFLVGYLFLIIGLFKNAQILIRKEGFRFSNLLTLFAGIAFVLFIFVMPILSQRIPAHYKVVHSILACLTFTFFYVVFVFVNFLSSSFLYQFFKPRKPRNFIIVLGSGLRNGKEVPPLLASRIDVALDFYWKQATSHTPPLMIFSGGQGDDELIPEGEAMRAYAINQGLPQAHAYAEVQSTTTYENMLYSKAIMDEVMDGKPYNCLFSSNTFHIFRASQYAQMVGLDAQGIGSKTARYFVPNAFIREFIALMVMHKRFHLVILGMVYALILLGQFL